MDNLPEKFAKIAVEEAKRLLQLFENQGNYTGIVSLAREIGMIYLVQLKEYKMAIQYLNLSLNSAEEIGQTHTVGQNLSDIGLALLHLERFEEALTYTERAFKMLESSNDLSSKCIVLGNLGVISRHLKNFDQAIKYSKEAIKLDVATGDIFGEAEDNKNLGHVYNAQEKFSMALDHYRIAGQCYKSVDKMNDYFHVLCHEGETALKLEKYDEAIQFYQEARALEGVKKEPVLIASLYFNLGLALMAKLEYNQAAAILEEGAALIEDGELKSHLLKALGDTYHKRGDIDNSFLAYTEAIDSLKNCFFKSQDEKFDLFLVFKLLILKYSGDLRKEFIDIIFSRLEGIKEKCREDNNNFKMKLLRLLIQIAIMRNDNMRSAAFLEEAIKLAELLGDRFSQAHFAEILAKVKKVTGELLDVERFRKMAADIFEDMGIKECTVNQFIGIANSLKERGLLEEAIKEYKKAIQAAEEIGYHHGMCVAQGNMANAYRETGDIQTAITILDELLETCEETERDVILRFLGFCYEDLGDIFKALKFHRMSYDITVKHNDKEGQLFQLGNIGRLFYSLGMFDQALEFKLEALNLSNELGYLQEQANQLSGIGVIYMAKKNPDAIEYLETALAINQKIDNQYEIALINSNIGNYYIGMGEFSKAILHLENSQNLCQNLGSLDILYKIYWQLGNAYEKAGNLPLAGQYYTKSIKEIEFLRKNMILEEHKLAIMGSDKTFLYNHLAVFNIQNGDLASAFEVIESGKSRSFIDLLRFSTLLKSSKSPPETRAMEIELTSSIKSTYKAISHESDNDKKRMLIKRIRKENEELERLFEEMKKVDPEYVALRLGMSITFEETKRLLR